MSNSPLVIALAEFAAAPADVRAAGAAESALAAATPDQLADALDQFPVELEVALAIERRLKEFGTDHPGALARIARVRAMHADDEDSWQKAMTLTKRVLTVAPDNVIALETGILLYAFVPDAPRASRRLEPAIHFPPSSRSSRPQCSDEGAS